MDEPDRGSGKGKEPEWEEVGRKRGQKKAQARERRLGETVELLRERHAETGAALSLRFEAEGDARFAADVLGALRQEKIPFHAQVHHFEDEGHANVETAKKRLAAFGDDVEQKFGMNLARMATGSASQDFIFTRNLALTDSGKTKSTIDFKGTKTVHVEGIRQRSGSLSQGGELVMGGSGFPFVARNPEDKSQISDPDLMNLTGNAKHLGLAPMGSYLDRTGVMKNVGSSLEGSQGQRKETVMHRFKKL